MTIDGNKILEYRQDHGISLLEMAQLLDMDEDQLYNYEQGVDEWDEEDALTIMIIDNMFNDLAFISLDDIDEYNI